MLASQSIRSACRVAHGRLGRHLVDSWIEGLIAIDGPLRAEDRGNGGAERVDEHHTANLIGMGLRIGPRDQSAQRMPDQHIGRLDSAARQHVV